MTVEVCFDVAHFGVEFVCQEEVRNGAPWRRAIWHAGDSGSSRLITNTRSDMGFVKGDLRTGSYHHYCKFRDKDDILNPENESSYGLIASIFTKDLMRGVQVANLAQAGTVWVNCMH